MSPTGDRGAVPAPGAEAAAGKLIALTRPVSASMAACELTHVQREPIDIERARTQHAAYARALVDVGCQVVEVPGADHLPDAVFVEDTALVLDEVAIVTRPGAQSRRAETAAVAQELARHRTAVEMPGPATLDGGDVLRIGRTLYIGTSGRTSGAGVTWLREIVAPFGYRVLPVEPTGCLHLKTAVTAVAPDLLLFNPQWVDPSCFGGMRHIAVAQDEPFAANALLIGERVIYPASFEKTARRLREAGIDVLPVDASELGKAEGGVTCCSIVFVVNG